MKVLSDDLVELVSCYFGVRIKLLAIQGVLQRSSRTEEFN